MRSLITGIVACTAFVAILAACGGSSNEGTPYKEPAGPAVATLKVKSGNVFFKPTELDSPKGVVKLSLENIESGTHDLVIRGMPGFLLEVSGEGSTASGKVDLTKKQYEFYCTIPGHEEAGMKGTITVVIDGIDPGRIPRHIAIVMDGNGRWAQQRGLKRTEGHAAGEEALFDTVEGGLELGLPWMTVYAFSTENWRRPIDEVRFLMRFNESLLLRRRDDLNERGVRVRFIGRRGGRVPQRVLRHIEDTEALTARNRRMTLTFVFNYGGRAELTDAVSSIAAEVAAGTLKPDKISDRTIARHLYAPDMPDPDLMVRTSGEYRISNYLLWQSAYSEFLFTDVLWPDFRREHLFDAVREFQRRDRRFGTV